MAARIVKADLQRVTDELSARLPGRTFMVASSYGKVSLVEYPANGGELTVISNRSKAQLYDAIFWINVGLQMAGVHPPASWRPNPIARRGSRAKFKHKRLRSPRAFAKGSLRTIQVGRRRLVVGCPKGKYSRKRKSCKVGTRAQAVLTPKRTANARQRIPYPIGTRVQLHAATDAWMQGDRYGAIVGYGRARQYRDTFTGELSMRRPVRVKLDKSGRVRRFHPDNIFPIEGNPAAGVARRLPRHVRGVGIGRKVFAVRFSAQEIREFRDKWPLSKLPGKPITFYFDAKGDYVETSLTTEELNRMEEAASGAMHALIEDAKKILPQIPGWGKA